MALTIAQQVFREPTARVVTAVLLHPTDPNLDGIEVPQAIADHEFDTGPGETFPGLSFKSIMAAKNGLKLSESLTQPGQLTGTSKFAAGRIIVDADEDIEQNWRHYYWNGTAVEIYLGARYKADGTLMTLDDFDVVFRGVVNQIRAIGDRQFEITFADARLAFESEFSTSIYKGFGGAFPIRTQNTVPVGTFLDQDHDPAMDITGSLTIEWIGHIEQLRANQNGFFEVYTPILMNGDNGQSGDPSLTVNYGLFINHVAGTFAFAGGLNGLNESTMIDSGHAIVLDEPTYFAVTVGADGQSLTFYASRLEDESPIEVGTGFLPFPLATGPVDGMKIGMSNGSWFVTYEMRLWAETRAVEDLQTYGSGPISNAADFPDLVEMWRFSEGTLLGSGPEYVFGEKRIIDLRPVGDPAVWESSYTGDDPDLFAGSVAGKSKAITYGRVNNLQLVRIDTQHHIFGWDSQATTDVLQVRMSGVPMVPEYNITAVTAGDFVFTNIGNTITLTNANLGTLAKFIPGQFTPARLGQRIEITGATNAENNGIFRVAIDGISPNGLVMTVADRIVVNETAPAGTRIGSYEPDVQYSFNLARSSIVLKDDPIGDVTADVIGRMPVSGTAKWSELFELIVNTAPDDSEVVFDPELGFHLKPGSGMTTNQLLDNLAKSAFGWWIEEPGGGTYRIGNFAIPGEAPATELLYGPEIQNIEPLRSLKPFHRFSVGWGRMWYTQTADNLASSVNQADSQRWAQEFTFEFSSDPTVLDRYPIAIEHEAFRTWITAKSDAVLFKQLAKSMLSIKHDWFKLHFGSLWAANIRLNDVVRVTWDDVSLGLITKNCRVVARDIDTGNYFMTLEVHT